MKRWHVPVLALAAAFAVPAAGRVQLIKRTLIALPDSQAIVPPPATYDRHLYPLADFSGDSLKIIVSALNDDITMAAFRYRKVADGDGAPDTTAWSDSLAMNAANGYGRAFANAGLVAEGTYQIEACVEWGNGVSDWRELSPSLPVDNDDMVIFSLSGYAMQDSTLTITGRLFGVKESAAPLLWSDFEEGETGALITTGGQWNAYNSISTDRAGYGAGEFDADTVQTRYTDQNQRGGSGKAVLMKFNRKPQAADPRPGYDPCNHEGYGLYNFIYTLDDSSAIQAATHLYAEFWFRPNLSFPYDTGYVLTGGVCYPQRRQWKICRWRDSPNGDPAPSNTNGYALFTYYNTPSTPSVCTGINLDPDANATTPTSDVCDFIAPGGCYSYSRSDAGSGSAVDFLASQWRIRNLEWNHLRWMIYTGEPDAGADVNGYSRVYINHRISNNAGLEDVAGVRPRAGPIKLKETPDCRGFSMFRIGEDLANSLSDHIRNMVDNVYIDSTFARVVVTSSATWDDGYGKHHEIQIPTAWSPTSISVTFNKGSLADRRRAYLYVIRADGTISNEGRGVPLYIGARFTPADGGGHRVEDIPVPGEP